MFISISEELDKGGIPMDDGWGFEKGFWMYQPWYWKSKRLGPKKSENEAVLIPPLAIRNHNGEVNSLGTVTEQHGITARSHTSSIEVYTADQQNKADALTGEIKNLFSQEAMSKSMGSTGASPPTPVGNHSTAPGLRHPGLRNGALAPRTRRADLSYSGRH
ncbi:hypothetical protein VM1G_10805 [Cytospora mali]|uniref:Uncharacterized protein n=1 Tax=Cytospora mali TaxID=578113 RepID=A0A194VJ69_CYTMA|nr:hypothetical protein VM1G_10805 [Valsa mali]